MAAPLLKVLSASDYAHVAVASGDEEAASVLRRIARRKDSIREEQTRFAELCDRFDNLYYANQMTKGGADHWPDDPNLKVVGKAHVSVNVHPTYVDVPAALQAVPPIENIVPPDAKGATIASLVERMYFAWKDDIEFETKSHKMATIKALYGRGAAKVVWDEELSEPQVHLVEQPRNLWLGWRTNDYTKLEWAVYSYYITPETAIEEYGLDVATGEDEATGETYLFVRERENTYPDPQTLSRRDWLHPNQHGMLEVNDYWYREAAESPTKGQRTKMQTCNIVTVGNCVVVDTVREEYDGELPYVPVFNTYIPGMPDGRSDLYDVEPILREKDERISAGGTMVTKLVGKQFWQLTGPEAPDRVPAGLRPEPDRVVAPGPGNRIEAISPWMPEFQLEAYLARLDRELQDISGLNDLLRGLAPAQVLSSSKAINALVANYEARITLRRMLFYKWRQNVWNLAKTIWGQKMKELKAVLDVAGTLVIKPPSLTPRDDIEQATMALNLLNGKVWSLERAQDATGVEDPQREQQTISGERQNPDIFPQDVQARAALMATMQQLQMTAAQMGQMGQQGPPPGDAEAQAMAAAEAQRGAADQAIPGGSPMMNGEGEQGVPPEGSSAFNQRGDVMAQTMVQNGEATNRLLMQTPLTETE